MMFIRSYDENKILDFRRIVREKKKKGLNSSVLVFMKRFSCSVINNGCTLHKKKKLTMGVGRLI
jgi:hypothetical protein